MREIAEKRAKYWSDYNTDMRGSREEGKMEVALNMLNLGVDLELISSVSGFSVEEILKFQNK